MRIAYLTSRYPLVSHTFVLREVDALRREGMEVHTFTVRRPGPEHLISPADREADASTYAILPARPATLLLAHVLAVVRSPRRYLTTLGLALRQRPAGARAALWGLFYFAEAGIMLRECRRRGIRHVHAHHANVAADVALLTARLGGEGWSWSFTLHGPTELYDVGEHCLPAKARHAAFVVCTSYYVRSQLMGMLEVGQWPKLRVIRVGVDLSEWAPSSDRRPGGAGEVLSVGRAAEAKGQPLLIEAMAELRQRGVEARLTVVGDGPLLGELRAQVRREGLEDRVTLTGAVGQDRIRDYYERADVFALSSFAEGLPTVLVEALAMEVPVVTTWVMGVPELVEDGVSGLLVPPGRADALANALERLLAESPQRRAGMGQAGRRKVGGEFALDRSARELCDLFEASAQPSS